MKKNGRLIITHNHVSFLSSDNKEKWIVGYMDILGIIKKENKFKINRKYKENVLIHRFWVEDPSMLNSIDELLSDSLKFFIFYFYFLFFIFIFFILFFIYFLLFLFYFYINFLFFIFIFYFLFLFYFFLIFFFFISCEH